MKKNTIILALVLAASLFVSCDDSSGTDGFPDMTPPPAYTGKYTNPISGYVTYYDDHMAESTSAAYYTPELESGWYHCAVSEPKYNELPAGTAIELTANNKTIHLMVTDLCPSATNPEHTSKPDYFFDLQESAFRSLADASQGILQMTFKVIPYPTTKNVGFMSTSTESYYLQGRFYNSRYPILKAEYSLDGGISFAPMQAVAPVNTNLYCIASKAIPSTIVFRLTDVHNQVIVTGSVNVPAKNSRTDLGKNFQY